MTPSDVTPPPIPTPRSTGGLAMASLVLGILGLLFSLVVVGGALGMLGLALGVMHLARGGGSRRRAAWGTALSLLAILLSIGLGVAYFRGIQRWIALAQAGDAPAGFRDWVGAPAPDLEVATLGGETLRLSDLRGRRVVLDFWATWCPPCVQEIPHFIQLTEEVPDEDLVIIGISDEDPATVAAFVRERGVNYPVGGALSLVPPYNQVRAIPTTFFIDRAGVIQEVVVGYHGLEDLRRRATAADYDGQPRSIPPGEDPLP